MGKRILLIGGGGHCRSVLDSVLSLKEYEEIGIIDNNDRSFLDSYVVGTDDDITGLYKQGWTEAFITVGSVGNTNTRRRLYEMIKSIGLKVPTIIDPTATIGKSVNIDEGVFIGKRAVVNAGSQIHKCAIINTGAIIEHDCEIGEFSHISPGAVLCGEVSVGHDSHIGAGSIIRQLIHIGNQSLIGIGSIIVKDIPSNAKAYGNPCRVKE